METTFTWEIKPFTVKDVLTLIEDKQLILRPEYQRRSVWSRPAKSSLIETVIQKKPIPLFLIHKKDNGILEVIDGQQRLRSLLDFYKDDLKLINVDDEINKKLYSEFEPSLIPEYDYKNIFKNYELYFNLVENANEDEIIDMYSRVNKYTVNLNKMEMRYALNHDTNIMKFIEELSDDEYILEFFLKSGIFTQSNVDRMGDIEFFTQLLIYILENSFMNKDESITDFFSKYSDIDIESLQALKEEFLSTLAVIQKLFTGNEFSKYFDLKEKHPVEYYLKNTRFKQKNDFLSLFCTLNTLKKYTDLETIESTKLSEIRHFLIFMDFEVAPQSDIKITAEYGTKCVSQANTKSSREFRSKFILEGFNYILNNDFYDKFQYAEDRTTKVVKRLGIIENLFNDINNMYELIESKKLKSNNSSFEDLLNILWEDEDDSEGQ